MAVILAAVLYSQTAFSQTVYLVCTAVGGSTTSEFPLKIDYNNRMVIVGSIRIPAQITDTSVSFRTDQLLPSDTNYSINRLTGTFLVSDPQNRLKPDIGSCKKVQPM